MAGNVVMVKHASNVPQCAAAFEQLWLEAGAPQAPTPISDHLGPDLTADRRSPGRRRGVDRQRGSRARSWPPGPDRTSRSPPWSLGGSDAFIALADADLDKSGQVGGLGEDEQHGQCCVAAKRFIVVDDSPTSSSTSSRLRWPRSSRRPDGRGDHAGADVHRSGASTLIGPDQQAVPRARRSVMGGRRIDRAGAFVQPTILTDIKPDNPAYYEEFFGPVALFFRVKDEDEAVALANDSPSGWAARSSRTTSLAVERVAEPHRHRHGVHQPPHLDCNRPTVRRHQISGYGRELAQPGHPGVRQQEACPCSRSRRQAVT